VVQSRSKDGSEAVCSISNINENPPASYGSYVRRGNCSIEEYLIES
jgi:hypothetical protein